MNIVEHVYTNLKEVHTNLSKSEFTTQYLNKSRSYWFNRQSLGKQVSTDVLVRLHASLKQRSAAAISLAESKPNHAHFNRYAMLYTALADDVQSALLMQ